MFTFLAPLEQSYRELKEAEVDFSRAKRYRWWSWLLIVIPGGRDKLRARHAQYQTSASELDECRGKFVALLGGTPKKIDGIWQNFAAGCTYLTTSKRNFFETSIGALGRFLRQLEEEKPDLDAEIQQVVTVAKELSKRVRQYNLHFVAARKQDYSHLFRKGKFSLDDQQQTAVIVDDENNLVVAGAGSGKTEVLVTRIGYLLQRTDKIEPERILALAFQNKAAEEMQERLFQRYGVKVQVKTFHSLGNSILRTIAMEEGGTPPSVCSTGNDTEVSGSRQVQLVFEMLLRNKSFQRAVLDYLQVSGNDEKLPVDFSTKQDYYEYMRSMRYQTLDGKNVKSRSEQAIYNYLYTHRIDGSDVKLLYEEKADWMKYEKNGEAQVPQPDFFLPEFDIYIEHWALGKRKRVPEWFSISTEEYKAAMQLKIAKFNEQTKYALVETSQEDWEEGELLERLESRLTTALKKRGYKGQIRPIPYEEAVEKVWDSAKATRGAIPRHLTQFINIAKTHGNTPKQIQERLNNESFSEKQLLFCEIALPVYREYQKLLRKRNEIDFGDMINQATAALKKNPRLLRDEFDHILIDEYQDISPQRYELIKALRSKNDGCKLFCVGDDWQSIMGFSGAEPEYFVHFEKHFPDPAVTILESNYRSSPEIVEIGQAVISHNGDAQIRKNVRATTDTPGRILTNVLLHQPKFKKQYFTQTATHCMDTIRGLIDSGVRPEQIMILRRIMQCPPLINPLKQAAKARGIRLATDKLTPGAVRLMSVHKSKGLEAEHVFILNVDDDVYGFPCLLERQEIFEPAGKMGQHDKLEEERRLFYVALTRAKRNVYIYTLKQSPSPFINEVEEELEKVEIPY